MARRGGRRRNSEYVRAAVCLLSGINRSLFRRESERCPVRVARAALLFECGADIGCRYIAIRPSKYPIDRFLSRVSVTIPRQSYRFSFLPSRSSFGPFFARLPPARSYSRRGFLLSLSLPLSLSLSLSLLTVQSARERRLSRTATVTRDNEPTSAHLVSLDPTMPTDDRSRANVNGRCRLFTLFFSRWKTRLIAPTTRLEKPVLEHAEKLIVRRAVAHDAQGTP